MQNKICKFHLFCVFDFFSSSRKELRREKGWTLLCHWPHLCVGYLSLDLSMTLRCGWHVTRDPCPICGCNIFYLTRLIVERICISPVEDLVVSISSLVFDIVHRSIKCVITLYNMHFNEQKPYKSYEKKFLINRSLWKSGREF